MAVPKVFLVCLAFSLLILHTVDARTNHRSLLQPIDCNAACKVRCSKAGRENRCKSVCGDCCRRCNCVPPGTYGNKEMCPCYAKITTHGDKPKCP